MVTIFFFILILLAFAAAIVTKTDERGRRTALVKRLTMQNHFDEFVGSENDLSAIGFNFTEKTVLLCSAGQEKVYSYNSIASAEVIKNGITLTQTNRGSQVLGGIVGGLALGGVGALVGGLSGSKRSKEQVEELSIKIIVDDTTRPVYVISIFQSKSKKGAAIADPQLRPYLELTDRIQAHLVNIMRQAQKVTADLQGGNVLSASELTKFWELHQAGVLTAAEFETQKDRLLGKEPASLTLEDKGAILPLVTYAIELVSCGNKIKAIKAVREYRPELSLRTAKDLIDRLPKTLMKGVRSGPAQSCRQKLVQAGIEVNLVQESE